MAPLSIWTETSESGPTLRTVQTNIGVRSISRPRWLYSREATGEKEGSSFEKDPYRRDIFRSFLANDGRVSMTPSFKNIHKTLTRKDYPVEIDMMTTVVEWDTLKSLQRVGGKQQSGASLNYVILRSL